MANNQYTEQIAKDYDLIANEDSIPPTARLYDNAIINSLPKMCGTIVDAGCGTGALSIKLSNFGKNVKAFDISPNIVRVAKSRNYRKNIDYAISSIEELHKMLKPSSCSSIIVNRALHHCRDLKKIINNLLAILEPNGKLIILDLDSTGNRKSQLHRNILYLLYLLTVLTKSLLRHDFKQALIDLITERKLYNSKGWQQHLSHEPDFCWHDINIALDSLGAKYTCRRINWRFLLYEITR